MDHPYCYPGTNVYRNKENLRDRDELEQLERLATARRLVQAVQILRVERRAESRDRESWRADP